MTSEPHRRAIRSLRAVALDAPDIDLLATFYEQLAGWRRVPDDDDHERITSASGDGGVTSEPHRRAIGSLRAVALDAPAIDLLATFYEQLAGWRRVPDDDDDEWITIASGDGWRIGLQRATDHVPPHWPDQDRPQQAHLDFRVPDIDGAAEPAHPLGASLLRPTERWHTLADPAGHPFDLCVNPDDPRTTLMGVMLDCPDAKALSHFYAHLLGKPLPSDAHGI